MEAVLDAQVKVEISEQKKQEARDTLDQKMKDLGS